jgi:hypothetical protein
MIRITRVVGESFDLETKTETPKALVLSNGIREFHLYVDDDTALSIIAMIQETGEASSKPALVTAFSFTPDKPGYYVAGRSPLLDQSAKSALPALASVEELPEVAQGAEGGDQGPGDEYNDVLTGAGSL